MHVCLSNIEIGYLLQIVYTMISENLIINLTEPSEL